MAADATAALDRFLEGWIESGDVTAVFGAVAVRGRTVWSAGAAEADTATPTVSSLFDAASLTKPWIATLALRLEASGELPLSTTLGEVWPQCAASLAGRTLEQLLRHRAGFEPWTPLYRRCRTRDEVERLLISGVLVDAPQRDRGHAPARERLGRSSRAPRDRRPGAATQDGPHRAGAQRYSDLDYILWGLAAERRLGAGLQELLRRHLLEPASIAGVAVRPGPRAEVVPCRCDNAREVELAAQQRLRVARRGPPALGEPQDGNARFLDGLAGHAGLFVSAEATLALAREWLRATTAAGNGGLLHRRDAAAALAGAGEYALGWARRRVAGSAGRALPRAAFGHVGFTGTSLWIDPESGAAFVLLAHRRGVERELHVARRRFHSLAAARVREGAGG